MCACLFSSSSLPASPERTSDGSSSSSCSISSEAGNPRVRKILAIRRYSVKTDRTKQRQGRQKEEMRSQDRMTQLVQLGVGPLQPLALDPFLPPVEFPIVPDLERLTHLFALDRFKHLVARWQRFERRWSRARQWERGDWREGRKRGRAREVDQIVVPC